MACKRLHLIPFPEEKSLSEKKQNTTTTNNNTKRKSTSSVNSTGKKVVGVTE